MWPLGRDLQASLLALQQKTEKNNGQPCLDVLHVDISALNHAIASSQEDIQILVGRLVPGLRHVLLQRKAYTTANADIVSLGSWMSFVDH